MTRLSAWLGYSGPAIRNPMLYPAELRARPRKPAVSGSFCQRYPEMLSGTERKRSAHRGTMASHYLTQNENGPPKRFQRRDGPNQTKCDFDMADSYPKKILPMLEGKIGQLRMMRFWSLVDMHGPDVCWNWQGSINRNGYGRFKLASYHAYTASRIALIGTKQAEPDGLHVLHTCDNRACCNPAHLYFGTHKQNMDDKTARNRHRSGDQSGANNGAAKIDDAQLAVIVTRLRDGWNNKQIAADMPIGHAMVSKIRLGHMWRDQTAALGYSPQSRLKAA